MRVAEDERQGQKSIRVGVGVGVGVGCGWIEYSKVSQVINMSRLAVGLLALVEDADQFSSEIGSWIPYVVYHGDSMGR